MSRIDKCEKVCWRLNLMLNIIVAIIIIIHPIQSMWNFLQYL